MIAALIIYFAGVILFECLASIPDKETGFTKPLDNWYSTQIRIWFWPLIVAGLLLVGVCYAVMCIILNFLDWMALKKIYLWEYY